MRSQAAARLSALLALAAVGAGCGTPDDRAPAAAPGADPVGEHGAEGIGYGNPDRADQVAMIDSVMMEPVREGLVAGASVAVTHRGETVAIRGYGRANLELDVPTPRDAVYEIGSITKQFTSVALLQLQEQGLVDLDADASEYLPDIPVRVEGVTVRELLDHTSGMRGYTEMPEARPYFARRVPRDSLLALIAARPFDFATGEHAVYNNSAFYLAGMIVEAASGASYEDYVEERIFEELGMERSSYCSETEIQEGKATGYDAGADGLAHKGFIVHNIPFAAGSLCSSAADLAVWLDALHGGRVLADSSYRQLVEPGDLNDGTRLRYGLGIAVSDVLGHRAVHHGGGINGFLSESLHLPDEELSVVVLMNTAGPSGPSALARAIVKVMVGDATPDPLPFDGDPAWFEGEYEGPARAGTARVRIAAEGDRLTATMLMQAGEEMPEDQRQAGELAYLGGATFGLGDALFTFEGGDGAAEVLRWDVVAGYAVMSRR